MSQNKKARVGNVKFVLKHDRNWEEYRVTVYENGKLNDARAYFTDDKDDAEGTMQAMIAEERKNQGLCWSDTLQKYVTIPED